MLHLLQPSVPFHEVGVAATLVLFGVLLIAGQHVLKTRAALLLFCLAGLVYRYAYVKASSAPVSRKTVQMINSPCPEGLADQID